MLIVDQFIGIGKPEEFSILQSVNIDFSFQIYAFIDMSWKIITGLELFKMEEMLKIYIKQLMLMIRAKVILNGLDTRNTKIKWIYPININQTQHRTISDIWEKNCNEILKNEFKPIAISKSDSTFS